MGQTLENGVYLPSEGERNCYAGLKTNWEILDQKVADVTALQQAVAGALHREIVESLPTTDIDPNTIYMILSGTSATENVYNEFVYVNNAWELIGTSATDLTNYYTKAEVDGKLLLKASASDLTSHTGDTTIHVTTADKNKWNNNTYVFRYSSTALVASSTNSNTLLDNTDNLKVGDKVIDSSGVLFSITAIDTANSTFTVGSALVDLALDGNVVHTSGNETVGGKKIFSDDLTIYNYDSSQTTKNLNISSSKIQVGDTSNSDAFGIRFNAGASYVAQILAAKDTTGTQNLQLSLRTKDGSDNFITSMVRSRLSANGNSSFEPGTNDSISLGSSSFKWKSVYATNYYYGSNNVEFSTKFVTTDTNQTISGNKTFSDNLTIYDSDDTQTPKGLIIRNAQWGMGESGGATVSSINFLDKNSAIPASIIASKGVSGQSFLRFSVRTKDSQNNTYAEEIYYNVDTSGSVSFRPWHDNIISLGTSAYRWKSVYGTNYYYGANNVEFSDKFVTTDTAQTISGAKTFSEDVVIGNSDTTQSSKRLVLRSYKASLSGSNSDNWGINFNAGASYAVAINAHKSTDGAQGLTYTVRTQDSNNNIFTSSYRFRVFIDGNSVLEPDVDNNVSLGRSTNRWKDCQTKLINGLEPSSLSLPSSSGAIDISSYITDLTGVSVTNYTPLANGYIVITCNANDVDYIKMSNNLDFVSVVDNTNNQFTSGILGVWQPCVAGIGVQIRIKASALHSAKFIPCQGNI